MGTRPANEVCPHAGRPVPYRPRTEPQSGSATPMARSSFRPSSMTLYERSIQWRCCSGDATQPDRRGIRQQLRRRRDRHLPRVDDASQIPSRCLPTSRQTADPPAHSPSTVAEPSPRNSAESSPNSAADNTHRGRRIRALWPTANTSSVRLGPPQVIAHRSNPADGLARAVSSDSSADSGLRATQLRRGEIQRRAAVGICSPAGNEDAAIREQGDSEVHAIDSEGVR